MSGYLPIHTSAHAFYSSIDPLSVPIESIAQKSHIHAVRDRLSNVQNLIEAKLKTVLIEERQASQQTQTDQANLKRLGCQLVQPLLSELSDILKNPKLTADNWHVMINPYYEERIDKSAEKLISYIEKSVLLVANLALEEKVGSDHLQNLGDLFGKIAAEKPIIEELVESENLGKKEDVKTEANDWLAILTSDVNRVFGLFNAIVNILYAGYSFFSNANLNVLKQYQSALNTIQKHAEEALGHITKSTEQSTPRLEVCTLPTEQKQENLEQALTLVPPESELSDDRESKLQLVLPTTKLPASGLQELALAKDRAMREVHWMKEGLTKVQNTPIENSPELIRNYFGKMHETFQKYEKLTEFPSIKIKNSDFRAISALSTISVTA